MPLPLISVSSLPLLPLEDLHPLLVMDYKLGQDLPHELVVPLHKLLLLQTLAGPLRVPLILLFAHQVLEDALHVLVVSGDGEFGEWD